MRGSERKQRGTPEGQRSCMKGEMVGMQNSGEFMLLRQKERFCPFCGQKNKKDVDGYGGREWRDFLCNSAIL